MMCEVIRFWNAPRGKTVTNAIPLAGSGWHNGLLVKRGRTMLHLILMDSAGLRVSKVPLVEERNMEKTDYSVAKAKKRFRVAFKIFGGTREARRHLKG